MYSITDAYENAYMKSKQQNEYVGSRLDKMETVDIFEATPEEILGMKYSRRIDGMHKCQKCNKIFSDDDEGSTDTVMISGTTPIYGGFDNYYDEPYSYEEDVCKCPYCGSKSVVNLYTDDLDDSIPNVDDYIEGFTLYYKKWLELQESKKITESNNTKISQDAEDDKSSAESEEDTDFSKLKDTVKKEMYKYLKSNGIDVEHLIKSGIELEVMKPVIDKMLNTYVATSVGDYEREHDIGIMWDYDIIDNDIQIKIENI